MECVNPDPTPTGLFSDLPPRDRRPLPLRWWLLAAAAHLALLALPVSLGNRNSQPVDPLVVRLLAAPERPASPTRRPAPVPKESDPEPSTPVPEPVPAPPPELRPDSEPQTTLTDAAGPDPSDDAVREFEIQRLLEAVAAMDWKTPEAPSTLGRSTRSDIVEAMRSPLLSATDNAFDGMTAPAETEIVDRWMSPNGVHQVVVRGPDGNTYCGRQEAPNDLRPWLQMPMLFHRCAGGGKRSGNGGWRNN